ncbi:glucosyltransferase domain-containing protein [Pseudocitrobacter faecalis]|uniref:glucosyltransferase domain-containing protein n=1 Tax=Pseudocitrobacter faecalis TaxID=1398493 RepID=UPI003315F234
MFFSRKLSRAQFYSISCVLLLVYMGMVFSTGKPYTDDLARIMLNYLRWSEDGRPLADLVVFLLSFGGRIIDIAPMSQVLSILVCALSCLIIADNSSDGLNLKNLIATSILFTTPFFIQNASYHFDVITISLAILFAVIPLAFVNKGVITASIVFFSCSVASLSLYQPAIGVLYAYVLCRAISDDGINIKSALFGLFSSAIGIIFYAAIVAPAFLSGSYSASMSRRLPLNADGMSGFISNVNSYVSSLSLLFDGVYLYVFLAVFSILLCWISVRVFSFKISRLVVSSTALVAVVSSVIMFMIYKDAATYPRVMISVGAVISAIFIATASNGSLLRYPSVVALLIVCVMNLSYWSSAHNLINDSFDNEADISRMIRADTFDEEANGKVIVHGYPKLTKYSSFIVERMPLLGYIFHPNLGWNTTRLFSEITSPGLMTSKGKYNPHPSEVCGYIFKKYNGIYSITIKDGVLHVVFRNEKCL